MIWHVLSDFLSDDVIIYLTNLVEYDVTSGPGYDKYFFKSGQNLQ